MIIVIFVSIMYKKKRSYDFKYKIVLKAVFFQELYNILYIYNLIVGKLFLEYLESSVK